MATPTPGSASKRAATGVSTPSHLNQSSPPRSVPSPVTARHPAGKTPMNHPTTSSQGSKTLASTPMIPNLSNSGYTSSPNAALLSFGTPNGLGIDGATPAGTFNLPTPALGSTTMIPSMSDLGLTTSGTLLKHDEDAERRAKMRKVLRTIGRSKGRVSEEGIARISRRVGFANDIDAEKLTPEQRARKVGNRPISTAGNTIVVEVDLRHQVPRDVQVMYSVQSAALEEQGRRTGRVLVEDLKAKDGEVGMQAKLDGFARDLERLAKIDRLSSSGINCFEALSGVYTSLQRLYEQEKEAARVILKGKEDTKIMDEVRCRKSGKPTMHEGREIGLAIEYWTGDAQAQEEQRQIKDTDGERGPSCDIFKLEIEVESCPAALYPSLRVTESWLPDTSDLSGETNSIPWQDPAPTFVPADTGGDTQATDGQQKLPDLRFVAKLDPPLAMPYQTAMNILVAVGVTQAPMLSATPPQYATLLLHSKAAGQGLPAVPADTMTASREVLSIRDGKETTVRHSYTLTNSRLDYGYKLEEIPFSHPRQLVELLPTLRQWAFMGCLLRDTFQHATSTPGFTTAQDVSMTNGHGEEAAMPINIDLTTSPVPSLGIMWPAGNLNMEVLPNAHVNITDQEGIWSTEDADAASKKLQKCAIALEVCGDLGLWLEWIRGNTTA